MLKLCLRKTSIAMNVERELTLFDNLKKDLGVIYEHKGRVAIQVKMSLDRTTRTTH